MNELIELLVEFELFENDLNDLKFYELNGIKLNSIVPPFSVSAHSNCFIRTSLMLTASDCQNLFALSEIRINRYHLY